MSLDGCMDVDVVIRGRVWARAALSGEWLVAWGRAG